MAKKKLEQELTEQAQAEQQTNGTIKHDFKKIAEIMFWTPAKGESYEKLFSRMGKSVFDLPHHEIVDIVHAGGLQKWAETLRVDSQKELYERLITAMKRTIVDPAFQDKKKMEEFPPLTNFYYLAQTLDRRGKQHSEAESISEVTWDTILARKFLDERVAKMFGEAPDKDKFKEASEKAKGIWGFSDKDIDALRYFVCQSRHENHNPSMNKSIYLWGHEKQTGKTTIARAIVTILNGDKFDNFGRYESSLKAELQYNDHELPLSAYCNAVLLDEAMPKDTSKTYGQMKQALTSNTSRYNQKYKAIKTIPVKRYYFCTSNEPATDFIQDKNERRFYVIEMNKKPKQISFKEIYNIWKDFCINAEPEDDWQEWYNSFDFADGAGTRDMNEVINELILRREEFFPDGKTYVTPVQIARLIYKNEPSISQKQAVRSAMEEIFNDFRVASNPSNYRTSDCYSKALELYNELSFEDRESGKIIEKEVENDLPF